MTGERKTSNSSRMKLVAPRRGLKRTRSVFLERNGPTARNSNSKYKVNKRQRAQVSQDTGHALNWVDSLIRKGRGILDSLEEEEDSFRRELTEERQRVRIQERLIENALHGDLEDRSEQENSGIDTSSFRHLEETVRNTLTDYNNNINGDVDGGVYEDDKQNLQVSQDEEDQGPSSEQEEIVILSDEDESGPQEPQRSEGPESGDLESEGEDVGEGQEIDLISSDQSIKNDQWDEEENGATEGQQNDELESQEFEMSDEQDEEADRESKKEYYEQKDEQEDKEFENVKYPGNRLFPDFAQRLEERYKDESDVETQSRSPDYVSCYDVDGNEPDPRKENVVPVGSNLPEEQRLEKQNILSEQQQDQEHDGQRPVGQLEEDQDEEQEFESELDQEEEQKKGMEVQQDQEGNLEIFNEDQEQDSRREEVYEDNQQQKYELVEDFEQSQEEEFGPEEEFIVDREHFEKEQPEEPEQQSVYISADTSLQNPDSLYDYRAIANQAVQQIMQSANDQTDLSELPNDESFDDDRSYLTPEGSVRIEDERDGQRFKAEPIDRNNEVPEAIAHKRHEFHSKRDSKSSLLERLFKPRPHGEDADICLSSAENESSVYYSAEEPSIAEVEDLRNTESGSEEKNYIPSRYEVLFCESTYSATSSEDNEQVREPIDTYVSPFAEDPFSGAQKADDSKELLKRTLESLGESFDSESEDQMMVDANDFSCTSDDEFFSQTSDVDGYVINEYGYDCGESDSSTIKNLEISCDENTDIADTAGEKTPTSSTSTNANQLSDTDSSQSPYNSLKIEFPIFRLTGPDLIEEVENVPNDNQEGGLLLGEIMPGTEEVETQIVESEPIIQFESEPLNYANIILDEFTAPDIVEEVESDTHRRENEILLEEIDDPQTTGTVGIISTEPIVEQPEPLSIANVQLFELDEDESRDDDQDMVNFTPGPPDQLESFQLSSKNISNVDMLERDSSNEDPQQESSFIGDGEVSHEQHPRSVVMRILSSPSRALNNVLSGVRSVGNALTDFVKTIDAVNAQTDSDVENSTVDENHNGPLSEHGSDSEFESEGSLNNEVHRLDNIDNNGSNDYLEGTSFNDNGSDHQGTLSEVAALQNLARRLERKSISTFKENSSTDDNDVTGEEFETPVKRDNELELEIDVDDSFLKTENFNNHPFEAKEPIERSEEDEESTKPLEVKEENSDGMKEHAADNILVDEELKLNDQGLERAHEEGTTVAGQSPDRGSLENLKQGGAKDIKVYEGKDPESENFSSPVPVKHIEIESGDSEENPLQLEKANSRGKDSPSLVKEVEVNDENEDAVKIPVEVEDEREVIPEENDLTERQDPESTKSGSKKKRGRKRKHTPFVEESNRHKAPKSMKSQSKRSRGPITRSGTTPSPTGHNTRRNTRARSKRTR